MDNKPLVIIGLATYQRPSMLHAALLSLTHLQLPAEMKVILILCENSDDDGSEILINQMKEAFKFEVLFIRESQKGIVHTRNRILDESLKLGASYLTFFDDDERVSPNWLVANLHCLQSNKAQVVQGRVESIFPSSESLGEFKTEFPSSPKLPSGSLLEEAFTGNVIMDLHFVNTKQIRFNPKLNNSGGSDSLFFRQLYKKGAKIVFCNEAVIEETIPESRSNLEWLAHRKYRDGYCSILMHKLMGKWSIYFSEILRHTKNYYKFRRLLKTDLPPDKRIHYRFVMLEALGGIHAFLGKKINYYNKIHGE